ncbi:TIGR03943 family putative permease subunit [Paenibacillus sp. 1001270B_150601_E10]|uniref:TIGR03943 family putative permease subunit n=1 Tax=Paenibacillus sp. 1001270B_150601_E10 TaxID=2787079 RepID=UPI00189CD681|nr:TIGR03943 family protein [Paenibacillus sp. 1001270B_150601_E10]
MLKRCGERILDYIPGLLLIAWGIFIFWLHKEDALTLYISRRIEWMVKLAAVGCYFIGGLLLIQALVSKKHVHTEQGCSCSCVHDHEESPSLWHLNQTCGLVVLLLPFIMSWIWPPTALGSQAASLKGVDFTPSTVFTERYKDNTIPPRNEASIKSTDIPIVEVDREDNQDDFVRVEMPVEESAPDESSASNPSFESSNVMFPSDAFTEPYARYAAKLIKEGEIHITDKHFIETIMTLDLYREQFYGKRVTIEGFVHYIEGMKQGQLAVTRFAIQCCAADSTPYGVLAVMDPSHPLKKDEWVNVSGILQPGKFGENEVMELKIDRLKKIEPKKDPYVYQDLEFGLN